MYYLVRFVYFGLECMIEALFCVGQVERTKINKIHILYLPAIWACMKYKVQLQLIQCLKERTWLSKREARARRKQGRKQRRGSVCLWRGESIWRLTQSLSVIWLGGAGHGSRLQMIYMPYVSEANLSWPEGGGESQTERWGSITLTQPFQCGLINYQSHC